MRATWAAAIAVGALAIGFDAGATDGAYMSFAERDAAACARRCEDDGLCIAWSFQADGACELRATAPSAANAAAHGLSRRAPAGFQQAAPAPTATALSERTTKSAAPAVRDEGSSVREEDEISRLLLGGVDAEENGLR